MSDPGLLAACGAFDNLSHFLNSRSSYREMFPSENQIDCIGLEFIATDAFFCATRKLE